VSRVGRAALKELLVGAGNGVITGTVCAAVVAFWEKNIYFGAVIAMAMITNMIVAGVAGTLIPVLLRKMRIDPAVASSVFVTTCTDVTGFFSFLGLAKLFIRLLM
jgi:magnesium transporter